MVTKIRFCFGSNRLPFTPLLLPTMIYHPVQGQGKRSVLCQIHDGQLDTTAPRDGYVVFRHRAAQGIVVMVPSFGRRSPRPHGLVAID